MSTLVSVLLYTGPETSACIMWSDMVATTIADKCFITNRTRIRQYSDDCVCVCVCVCMYKDIHIYIYIYIYILLVRTNIPPLHVVRESVSNG